MVVFRSRRACVVLALLLAACSSEDKITSVRDGATASIGTRPQSVATSVADASVTSTSTSVIMLTLDSLQIQLNKSFNRARLVTWKSSDPSVATVSAQGLVIARAQGTADITASSGSLSPQVTNVRVEPGPAQVIVTPSSVSLNPGAKSQLSSVVQAANGVLLAGRTVTYRVLAAAIATVSSSGLVTAVATGQTTVVASSGNAATNVAVAVLGTVASVSIVASKTTLAIGEQVVLSAVATTSQGQVLSGLPVTWSLASGSSVSISSQGIATALSSGSSVVRATVSGVAGTITLSVLAPPPPPTLVALTIAPKSASLVTGASAQFNATALWSDGGTTLPAITYSATGGIVTNIGAYTAPSTAGIYRVVLADAGGSRRDTAVVTVTAPPPNARLANECSTVQAAWIFCDDFDQDRLSQYFEVDYAGGSFGRVSGTGNEGSFAMRGHFAAGQSGAGSLKLAFGKGPGGYVRAVDAGTTLYREVFWRMYVRNQDGWVGGGGDKLSRATSLVSGSWQQSMIAHVWSDGSNPDRLLIDPASGTDAAGNLITTTYNDFANLRWLGSASGTTSLFAAPLLGQWHCVEAHVRLNDAGQANGVFEMWVDGSLNATRTGLNWLGAYSSYGINAIFLENYWNAGSPIAQDRFFDNFIVSTQRIGC